MKLLKWLGVIVVGLIVIGFISAMLGDKPAILRYSETKVKFLFPTGNLFLCTC